MTVQETLTVLFNGIIEGLARVGYGLGGLLPPEDLYDESN